MRAYLYVSLMMCSFLFSWDVSARQNGNGSAPARQDKIKRAPLLFLENMGQLADVKGKPVPDVLFMANAGATKVLLSATSIQYQFTKVEYPDGYGHHKDAPAGMNKPDVLSKQINTSTHTFKLSLQGANLHPKIVREQGHTYTENYYLAHCPAGIVNVPSFDRIILEGVYPGIDWVIYANDDGLKYDFIVHPGADPSRIQLKVSDADSVFIDVTGEMVMETRLGTVRENRPVSYAGDKRIKTAFVERQDGSIGFHLEKYDPAKTLIIDPVVKWATYFGSGDLVEYATACETDRDGNVYLLGETQSFTGISFNGFQNTSGGYQDLFLAKFDSSGNRLWATYYGGEFSDFPGSCAVSKTGMIYITGTTLSATGIASGGFKNTHSNPIIGYDAFLAKFNSHGRREWATYYGDQGTEYFRGGIATDDMENVYFSLNTNSPDNISFNGFQNSFAGNQDAVLVKFNSLGARQWATYYGGSNFDCVTDCAVDKNGDVYMSGYTESTSGIASSGFQNVKSGGRDGFLVKFDPMGNRLWGTYYGGDGTDVLNSCIADTNGNIFIAGSTNSNARISSNGYQNTFGGGGTDAMLIKLDPSGDRQWATYYGGSGVESGYVTVDAAGNPYLVGITSSTTGIAVSGVQNAYGGGAQDGFVVKFDGAGNRGWGTYYGGDSTDYLRAATVDINGALYIAGSTFSTSGIATPGSFQAAYPGLQDAFLAKITNGSPNNIPNLKAATFSLNVFPNPCTGNGTILVNGWTDMRNSKVHMDVFDIIGRKVWVKDHTPGNDDSWSLPVILDKNIPSGMYLLRLTSEQRISTCTFEIRK